MTPMVFLINGFTKGNWLEALLFAASVAVGLTPEMLPMVVTANLAKGAVVMARRKAIVKRLNAIQNFGAMDILCTDKTGTLTQNKVILERHLDIHGNEDCQVLEYAWLNSFHQTGLKNLLDVAVLELCAAARRRRQAAALSEDRRNTVRLRAPPHVGGRAQRRRPQSSDLQRRDRGDAAALRIRRRQRRPAPAAWCPSRPRCARKCAG